MRGRQAAVARALDQSQARDQLPRVRTPMGRHEIFHHCSGLRFTGDPRHLSWDERGFAERLKGLPFFAGGCSEEKCSQLSRS